MTTNEQTNKSSPSDAEAFYNQINTLITSSGPIAWSWGMENPQLTKYNNKDTYVCNVNGFVFSGKVYISLNRADDALEINLIDKDKHVIYSQQHILINNLIDILDTLIETGGMSSEQYHEKIMDYINTVNLK